MILTTFHPGQELANLVDFCEKENVKPIVLSYCPILKYESYTFINGNLPPQDERFNHLLAFLNNVDEESVTILDWENIAFTSSVKAETEKQVKVKGGVSFSQESVRAQDFRLPPLMENLIMVAQILDLDKEDHLYNNNPFILTPKMIKGSPKDLTAALSKICQIRQTIRNNSISAVLPIINSNFKI